MSLYATVQARLEVRIIERQNLGLNRRTVMVGRKTDKYEVCAVRRTGS